MTKKQTGLLAVVLCATGFVSAGALAYGLSRPIRIPHRPAVVELAPSGTSALVASAPEPIALIELAPVVITGDVRPHDTPKEPKTRDISEMRCTDWRPLEQGSVTQMVRICD